MKIIRPLLTLLAILAALAVLLVIAAFSPPVQTWVAQNALSRHDVAATVGSVTAGLGDIDVRDLSLQLGSAQLTVPALTAQLPMIKVLRGRQVLVRTFEAKGWTLDLAPKRPVAEAGEQATPAQPVAYDAKAAVKGGIQAFASLLSGWRLPGDDALGNAELEGDILVPTAGAKEPAKVHLLIKGGGLTAGHDASFDLDATVVMDDTDYAADAVSAHGRLGITLDSEGKPTRIVLVGEFSDTSGKIPPGQKVTLSESKVKAPGDEDLNLEVDRGSQRLLSVSARFSGADQTLAGSWMLGVRDADVAFFTPGTSLPHFMLNGDGRFEIGSAFEQVHVVGRLAGKLEDLAQLDPSLEGVGPLLMGISFNAVQKDRLLQVDSASATLEASGGKAVLRTLQAFGLDESGWKVNPLDASKDWLDISVREFPLTRIKEFINPLEFTEGRASFDFTLASSQAGFSLTPKTSLRAQGVSLSYAGTPVATQIDLSLRPSAHGKAPQWSVPQTKIEVSRDGASIETMTAQATRSADPDEPLTLSGTWTADLDSPTAKRAFPLTSTLSARSASGDFSIGLAPVTKFEGKVTLVGHDPSDTFDATVNANLYGDGTVEFKIPAKLTLGKGSSDLSFDGTFSREATGNHIEMELSGGHVYFEHLIALAAPFRTEEGAPASYRSRDSRPFWAGNSGSVMLVFDQLSLGGDDYKDARGTLEMESSALHLKRGRGTLPHHTLENAEATLSFDPASQAPYTLAASSSPYGVDSPEFFAPKKGQDPVVEGHFTVTATIKGSGRTLKDLLEHTQEQYLITSTGGIFRGLNTSIADTIPEAPAPVSDTLSTVGSAVGTVFGIKSDIGSKNTVSKTAEAVIQFTNNIAEIGFDSARVTAAQQFDQTIVISDIALTAPDERLQGKGKIAGPPGVPIRDQALSLDLQVWVRGKLAELLKTAALVSTQKDADGYVLLRQPVHIGGTPANLDVAEWHDLLAKAANHPVPDSKKAK